MKTQQKKCQFCQQKAKWIDYKNIPLLLEYVNTFAKIKPRYATGTCLRHQKKLAQAIKRARYMALLSFVR